jgi:hypothetical protein
MSHPIGYFTGYNPATQEPGILHQIQECYGVQLQELTYEQKIVMRAALADYIANKPIDQSGNSISLIDSCIESAGVDWGIWDEDEPLVEVIQACSLLSEDDIEGLIEALTTQIRGKIYASRICAEGQIISRHY